MGSKEEEIGTRKIFRTGNAWGPDKEDLNIKYKIQEVKTILEQDKKTEEKQQHMN